MTGLRIAFCLGGALSVWDDHALAEGLVKLGPDDERCVVACNFAGIQYQGRLDAWATLHPERFDEWRLARLAAGGNVDYRAFVHRSKGCAAEEVRHRWHGSSGLYMAQIAIEAMGCAGAILCGVPMDDHAGHIHFSGPWPYSAEYRAAFEQARSAGLPIRSISGWTSELFGKPDGAWLDALRTKAVAA